MPPGEPVKRSINLQLPHARRILDVGCGTGWVASESRRTGTPVCIGLDYRLEPLREGTAAGKGVRFVQGDATALPFAGDTFDCVVGHVSMPYMRTREALNEIYRVLAPGGSIFLTFHSLTYVRKRMLSSIRRGDWKDVPFMFYVAGNAVLNRLALPQIQFRWGSRSWFETANTPQGAAETALKVGFGHVSAEFAPERIFFALTARKPDPTHGRVLAAPAWAVYTGLAWQADSHDDGTPEKVAPAYA
jgi:ubiquinone/menaquinone biosynthesis C-methylase UbiE